MKNLLQINNFKCFVNQLVELRDLTVLVGANGMGKSSVLQAILLLRQSIESNHGKVQINGPYGLALGSYDEIVSRYAKGDISFIISNENGEVVSTALKGASEYETYQVEKNIIISQPNIGICSKYFYYLSAERTGPRICQKKIEQEYPNTGVFGEQTAQLLNNKYSKIDPNRFCANCKSATLLNQVNAWLNNILPCNEVTADENNRMQVAQILLRNKLSDEYVTATNIGFGISYCLPIIVTGLIANSDSYFIIENPEAHLHPAAQTAMGEYLAFIAHCGVHVIIETHSDHILDGIQLFASKYENFRESIIINNFSIEGQFIKVTPITFNENIEYSDWPKGFMDTSSINYAELLKLRQLNV